MEIWEDKKLPGDGKRVIQTRNHELDSKNSKKGTLSGLGGLVGLCTVDENYS
jgi:hypothetical protein